MHPQEIKLRKLKWQREVNGYNFVFLHKGRIKMKYKFVNPNKVEISLKEVEDFLKSLNYNIIINDYHDDENPCFENDFFEVTVFGEKNHLRGGKVFECANFGILYKYEDIEVLMPFISCDIDYYLSVREAIWEVRKSLKNNAIIADIQKLNSNLPTQEEIDNQTNK